jgi:beta-1,4-mannosyl-glycoprotein beta-1,4-N-acetylglucosaminyltransferase
MANFGSFNTPQQLRNAARNSFNPVSDGGWHYSFMGGPERIKIKVESIAESHLIIDKVGNVDDIEHKMKNQKDLWNRTSLDAQKNIIDISNNKPKKMDQFLQKHPNFYYTGHK